MTEATQHIVPGDFKNSYLCLRQKEGRVYTDEEVTQLPNIISTHLHYKEWQMRKRSAQGLIKYLMSKSRPMEILEVGCGNGWLASKLSAILFSCVTGIDANSEELEQAQRVFSESKNLGFLLCSLKDEMPESRQFDIIVFAASLQYFSPMNEILKVALNHLKPGGEIHIIDSPFYKQNELTAARQRSAAYYAMTGFPEMKEYYFHHCIDDIKHFHYTILYDPDSFVSPIRKNKNPFPWIRIKHNEPGNFQLNFL